MVRRWLLRTLGLGSWALAGDGELGTLQAIHLWIVTTERVDWNPARLECWAPTELESEPTTYRIPSQSHKAMNGLTA